MRMIQEKLMAVVPKLKQNFACFHWMITGTRLDFFLKSEFTTTYVVVGCIRTGGSPKSV